MISGHDIRQLNAVALDPAQSVVIEACAGSGKTWLLVSRIVRLLLTGVKPSEILAITFTRKAAQEMEARLHGWLHLLATGDDNQVSEFLRDREVPEDEVAAMLPRARALFEEFLTDRPGITISTFHGWFLHLLKRAPLASGAASGSNLVDQTSALVDEAWELFAEGLQRNPGSQVAHALHWLFETYGLENSRSVLTNFLHKRAEWWAFTRAQPEPLAFALERLRDDMPVGPGIDVISEMFADRSLLRNLEEYANLLDRNATETDVRFASQLRAALIETDSVRRFERIWPVLFTANAELRVRKTSKAAEKRLGNDGQLRFLELHQELGRTLNEARTLLAEQAVYRLNEAGLSCGVELLDRYQSIKHERGLLDYTDVEWRAWLLLSRSDYAEYMHYKLDARYRHILLDEFQDTNPLQWQTIRSWLEASADVQSQPRVFLVGDPKQSIYRFRRAEPRLFDIARAYLCERHAARALEQNATRRNAPAVVSVVNSVFDGVMQNFNAHSALRDSLPGMVEALPLFAGSKTGDAQPQRWRNPLDLPRADETDRRRALEGEQLAARITEMVGRQQILDQDTRQTVRYKDILVLVARRTHLATYERELRHAQIPYVSTRQGGLLDTLEAADLTALLEFLVVPFADLQLATALRSPIFSASDDDLMTISHDGGGGWWKCLCKMVQDGTASDALARAQRLLDGWMQGVDLLPVHDLLDRIYFESDLARRYEAAVPPSMRTGVAANLRAFMEVALSTDAGRYPSLQGFLHELSNLRRAAADEAPDIGVVAEGMDAVRILTVHGAKGLEAPVVWLLDANAEAKRVDTFDCLVDWPPDADSPAHFSLFSRKEERGESRARLFDQDAQLAEREDMNLLYVAMTRAQQVFIASGIESRADEDSWYHRLSSAIEVAGTGARLPVSDVTPSSGYSPENLSVENAQSADTLRAPLRVGKRTDDLVDRRRRHGTLVHAALEKSVPPAAIDGHDDLRDKLEMADHEFDKLWEEVQLIVAEPQLARFFQPEHYVRAYNEFAYVSRQGELRRMDRVVEFDDEIWILDYKTGDSIDAENLEAAARPYRNQLMEYCTALGELMPGKPVKSALIFSGGLFYPM
jgi:ATP-dependent helicase/nuclease subunit A